MAAEATTKPAAPPVSAQLVANAFVQQYYHIMHQSPQLVHRFYQDVSKLGRPETDGNMSLTTTMHAINEKIVSLNYESSRAEIKSVDAQESYNGGFQVLVTGYLGGFQVLVTGYLTRKDYSVRSFAQSFFLAPQDVGYFVLNDMFRYVNDVPVDSVVFNDVMSMLCPFLLIQILLMSSRIMFLSSALHKWRKFFPKKFTTLRRMDMWKMLRKKTLSLRWLMEDRMIHGWWLNLVPKLKKCQRSLTLLL